MEGRYDRGVFPAKKTTQIIQGLSVSGKSGNRMVLKQLKKEFPHWRGLTKREKKEVAT
jgi:hypothetical protein